MINFTIFKIYRDKDGCITREEFERGVRAIGYDPTLPEVSVVADLATGDSADNSGDRNRYKYTLLFHIKFIFLILIPSNFT